VNNCEDVPAGRRSTLRESQGSVDEVDPVGTVPGPNMTAVKECREPERISTKIRLDGEGRICDKIYP
jgi:hypothetical protein